MPQPSPTWNAKRVFATWRKLTGEMEPGTWTLDNPIRIVNRLADGSRQIFRKGRVASGSLNTTEGLPSFDQQLPIVDDPDNTPQGGQLVLTVTFTSGGAETYRISPSLTWSDSGTDLATLLDPEIVPVAPPYTIIGVAGGVAALDNQGRVLDGSGNPVTGGGAGGGAGIASWAAITALSDYPAAVAAGSSQANARAAIGAGTSNLALGTTSSTAKAGNYVPAWSEVTGKPTSFTPATHQHAGGDLTGNVAIPTAVAPIGSIIVLVWDAASSTWKDKAGNTVTGRVPGRNDICYKFVGGSAAIEPAWATQDGDEHLVTS